MIPPDTFARYAAMRVPRYTSYPTAPNFSAAIDGTEYRRWLRSLNGGSTVSVYVHIPFCREMCWYCGCHTTVTRRQPPVSRYVDSLVREIRLVSSELRSQLKIGHLHWGGGSPTLLTPRDVGKIRAALADAFQFDPLAENAVEVDPRTLTEPLAQAFGHAGVNRASLGVQSFDGIVQAAINRIQSFSTTAAAVDILRSQGVPGINFDLIYGLPFQTVESCLDTVEQALKLQPDRFSVFGYAHVPSFKPHQRKIDEAALPDNSARQAQATAIAQALVAAGYRQIGLDHFALPGDSLAIAAGRGRLHRNFQGYTTDRCPDLIAFGASAIGRLPQGFVQNAAKIPDYERRIGDGRLATVRGCPINDEDSRRAAIIEQLMCNFRAHLGTVDVAVDHLQADGLIRRSGSWIEVTDEGRPLVRAVAAAFDTYLPSSSAAHVAAV
ncbi:oxygen-independent coproporphyrinogen III oxidase [Sphingomonas segetis]|jgi:oxygen-independent coproporphyrinogen-3 oxidase|uniref:oxygen-independent coproporphyrinogen III oxidase n=1 Tax=Sphingomonas segetis TaxID=1104779 RepID=UPI0012D35258|nr:oxygen-independent coproporphyrinogen III oxidase [Sphingomonas segetis]